MYCLSLRSNAFCVPSLTLSVSSMPWRPFPLLPAPVVLPVHRGTMAPQTGHVVPPSAYRLGCWAASAADTIERRWDERVPRVTSPQHTVHAKPTGGRGAQECRASVRRLPRGFRARAQGQRHRERRALRTQKVETATGRVRRAASPRADATSLCEIESNTHSEGSGTDKKSPKSAQKGLTIAVTSKGYGLGLCTPNV
jgi:hypothetical protein